MKNEDPYVLPEEKRGRKGQATLQEKQPAVDRVLPVILFLFHSA